MAALGRRRPLLGPAALLRRSTGLRVPLAASVRVDGRTLELRVARREGLRPGPCGGLTDCFRLIRVGPAPAPAPPPAPAPRRAFELVANGKPASGRPDDPAYTSSSGAGRVVLDGTGSFLVFDTFANRSELVAVRVTRIESASAGTVRATVRVSRSTRPGCAAGATGTLRARNEPDRIELAVCGGARVWTTTAMVAVRQAA